MKFISIIFILILKISLMCYPNSLDILSQESSRSKSMMGMVFLVGNDSSHIFDNPNTLNTLSLKNSFSVNYDFSQNYSHKINASYSRNLENLAFGFGLASDIYKTTNNNIESAYLLATGLSYRYNTSYFSTTFKGIITENHDNIDWGGFIDISYMQTIFIPALRVGIGAHNIGFYKNEFDLTATDVVIGLAYHKRDDTLTVSLEYTIGIEPIDHNVGIATDVMIVKFKDFSFTKTDPYDLPESVLDAPPNIENTISGLSLRLGVSMEGFGVGIGVTLDIFRLDYAIVFEEYDFSNIDHTFGISFMF